MCIRYKTPSEKKRLLIFFYISLVTLLSYTTCWKHLTLNSKTVSNPTTKYVCLYKGGR